jgi:glycosyltransferase involved in cell wall biosynthesis
MENKNNKKVIGIILAYKAATSLEALYKSLPMDVIDEVIISNDDTGDGIEEIAQKLNIPCYSHPRLCYGGNMKYGMKKAMELGADYIVEIHGDGQYDPSFIKPALEKIKQDENYGLVIGSRFVDIKQPLRDKMPLSRYLANISLTFIDRIILGVESSELHTGARVYNSEALRKVNLENTSNDFLFSFEIIAQIAYIRMKIGEVPVRCYYSKEHTSISIKRSIAYAFKTFGTLFYFIIARLGFKTKLFHK